MIKLINPWNVFLIFFNLFGIRCTSAKFSSSLPGCGRDYGWKYCPPPLDDCNPGEPDMIGSFDPNFVILPSFYGNTNWIGRNQVLQCKNRYEKIPELVFALKLCTFAFASGCFSGTMY